MRGDDAVERQLGVLVVFPEEVYLGHQREGGTLRGASHVLLRILALAGQSAGFFQVVEDELEGLVLRESRIVEVVFGILERLEDLGHAAVVGGQVEEAEGAEEFGLAHHAVDEVRVALGTRRVLDEDVGARDDAHADRVELGCGAVARFEVEELELEHLGVVRVVVPAFHGVVGGYLHDGAVVLVEVAPDVLLLVVDPGQRVAQLVGVAVEVLLGLVRVDREVEVLVIAGAQ